MIEFKNCIVSFSCVAICLNIYCLVVFSPVTHTEDLLGKEMDGLTETGDKAKVEAEVEGVVPSE